MHEKCNELVILSGTHFWCLNLVGFIACVRFDHIQWLILGTTLYSTYFTFYSIFHFEIIKRQFSFVLFVTHVSLVIYFFHSFIKTFPTTAWEVTKYGTFSWSLFSCIWTEYRKIRTRKKHFSRSARENSIFSPCMKIVTKNPKILRKIQNFFTRDNVNIGYSLRKFNLYFLHKNK